MSAWASVQLGDVSEFVRGINFKPEDVIPVGSPGSVACMRTKNVQAELDLSDVWGVGESFVKRTDQLLRHGDILVSSANSWNLVGKCCWVPELPWRATFGGFVSVLRPDRAKVDPRFVFRWFASDRMQVTVRSFGQQTTNISNLNIGRCLNLSFPLPPLPEQRRIAGVLDRADELRAKRRAALAQLDTLTQAIFLEMFGDPATNPKGWPVAALADLCTIAGEYGAGVASKDYDPNLPRYVRITDITDDGGLTPQPVSPSGPTRDWECYELRPGDVLFARSGATVGKTYLHRESNGACVFAGYLIKFRPNAARLLPEFLFHYTQSAAYRSWVLVRQRVVAQPNINAQQYGREMLIPVPTLEFQREFTRRVAAVEKLRTAQRASLAEMDALFASLQHRAFRGEI